MNAKLTKRVNAFLNKAGALTNEDKPEGPKACGATTRSSFPCKKWAMENGRCANHGGKSLSGVNHGRYKNGFWTQEAVKQRKKGNLSAQAILIMFELEVLIAKHGGANIP